MIRKTVLFSLAAISFNAHAIIFVDSFQDSNGMFHQTYCISDTMEDACKAPVEKQEPKIEKPVPAQIHLKRTDNKPVRQLPANVDLTTNYRRD